MKIQIYSPFRSRNWILPGPQKPRHAPASLKQSQPPPSIHTHVIMTLILFYQFWLFSIFFQTSVESYSYILSVSGFTCSAVWFWTSFMLCIAIVLGFSLLSGSSLCNYTSFICQSTANELGGCFLTLKLVLPWIVFYRSSDEHLSVALSRAHWDPMAASWSMRVIVFRYRPLPQCLYSEVFKLMAISHIVDPCTIFE